MDLKVVAMKVDSKRDAQHAYKALDDKHDAGETDYYEVLGMWKSDKGKVHSKYYGNHKRLVGTLVGAYFGLIPAVVGYYIGKHEMPKGKMATTFLGDLSGFVDNDGAAIFALVDEADAAPLEAFFTETYPGNETAIIDPSAFEADVAVMAEGVEA
jgi:hypothetical protein